MIEKVITAGAAALLLFAVVYGFMWAARLMHKPNEWLKSKSDYYRAWCESREAMGNFKEDPFSRK